MTTALERVEASLAAHYAGEHDPFGQDVLAVCARLRAAEAERNEHHRQSDEWKARAFGLADALAAAEARATEAIGMVDACVDDCCADLAGAMFCESYGCADLLKLRDLLKPAGTQEAT